jgi:hypothetical protein
LTHISTLVYAGLIAVAHTTIECCHIPVLDLGIDCPIAVNPENVLHPVSIVAHLGRPTVLI